MLASYKPQGKTGRYNYYNENPIAKGDQHDYQKRHPREFDVARLSNGNILITGTTKLLEFTSERELIWRLNLKVAFFDRRQAPELGFYKAEGLR